MALITAGSDPKAILGAPKPNPPSAPLTDALPVHVPKKMPKRKKAFGPPAAGKAFNKY